MVRESPERLHAGRLDTPTKLNLEQGVCTPKTAKATLKFLMEEIAVNANIPLDAENPEDAFGMAANPAMRFVGRGYTTPFVNSLAQIPPEKRSVLYAVCDAFDKLLGSAAELQGRQKIDQCAILGARVMKHFDAIVALKTAGNLDRAHLVPLLYRDINVPADADNNQIRDVFADRCLEEFDDIMLQVFQLAKSSGATLDEAAESIRAERRLENAPCISSFNGDFYEMDGTAEGGRNAMFADIYRPTTPTFIDTNAPALTRENAHYMFRFPGGEAIAAKTGSAQSQAVIDSMNAVADKIEALCGKVHQKQLSNVYCALSQSTVGSNIKNGLRAYGLSSNEHMAMTFTLSRNDETGAVTIKYSEPEGLPVKFNWTVTIDIDGNATATPMRVDHGQYEAQALQKLRQMTGVVPGKDEASARALIKDVLEICGDDFDLKEIVSKRIYSVCVNGAGALRTPEQLSARIDGIRANLNEIREAAGGNATIEKAGLYFMDSLHGKSFAPGVVGKIVKAAMAMDIGSFANLTPSSTPVQILKGVIDMRDAVSKLMNDEKLGDHLEGADEFTSVREFVGMVALAKIPPSRLGNISAATNSVNAQKAVAMLGEISSGGVNNSEVRMTVDQKLEMNAQAYHLRVMIAQYDAAAKNVLGQDATNGVPDYNGDFDMVASGVGDIFAEVYRCAEIGLAEKAAMARETQNVNNFLTAAKANAVNAYSKAGESNAKKVDSLVLAALKRCAANADAVKVVADNIDTLLVTNDAKLRTIADVRKRAEAIAANFAELQALAKDNPAVYEAGKAMVRGMGGKALPAGMIAKLVQAAANAKIDSMRKLSSRSTGPEIHRAVTELRDNLVQAMALSGAEEAAVGPDEKQACRNFLAVLIMRRCGEKTLAGVNGAFTGDTVGKMFTLYSAIANGQFNEGLEREVAIRLEDQAGSHMTHLAVFKDAIGRTLGQAGGAGLIPYGGDLNADEIGGPAILNDLVNQASS